MPAPDITKLKTSWTKYDAVQVINIIGNDELELYLTEEEPIDHPILKSYLGIKELSDPIPEYWKIVISEFPRSRKLFTLLAGIFTHYQNIEDFANVYSHSNMGGIFEIGEGGKHQTNIRSALVEGGAALNSYRRKSEVPYDFSRIFELENIGSLFKQLLDERLHRIGHSQKEINENFLEICYSYNFHKTLSLNKTQFKSWLQGKSIGQVPSFSYNLNDLKKYKKITAIKVNQWLTNWDNIDFALPMRSKPQNHFYIFKMDIRLLKRISDVHRRGSTKPRRQEINIQRAHKEERSLEIRNYVEYGFPLSTVPEKERNVPDNQVLRMPGLLPTAILVNIIGSDEKRGNSKIQENDLIKVEEKGEVSEICLPDEVFNDDWLPELKPLEIIDGQHRLWAFDEGENINGSYEVPVVAYNNLDRAWQAYLFYVINIKPKKINTSLGYDLYPLLRTQDWLENSKDGLLVYRETRAQELVEALWLYEESPWHNRINMLGQGDSSNISQNAFVRALSTSFLRKSARKRVSGLFGDILYNRNYEELKWVRAQQAAFLILLWDEISKAIKSCETGKFEWIDELRNEDVQLSLFEKELKLDKAFVSKNSNLSRDQGVSGISLFSNDFFYTLANESSIDFNSLEWDKEIDEREIESNSIDLAINEFKKHKIYIYLQYFSQDILRFDWRTSSANFSDENKRELQKKYRGSGGYREVWNDLLKVFLQSNNDEIKDVSIKLAELSK